MRVIVGIGHHAVDLREVALRTRHVIRIHHVRWTAVRVKLLRRLPLLHNALMTFALLLLLLGKPLILRDALSDFSFRVEIGGGLLLLLVENVLVR